MFYAILLFIFCRPFISSLSFPVLNSFYSAVFLLFLLSWIMVKREGIQKNLPERLRPPLILFILALIASTLLSQDRIHSLREFPQYLIGLLLFIIPFSLSPENKKRVISTIILAGISISFLAIYQYFFGFEYILNYLAKEKTPTPGLMSYLSQRRAFLPFISPNTLAGYLIMIIPLSLSLKKRIFFILPLGLALLFTKSLGALFSLFLGLMLYFYLNNQKSKHKITRPVMRQSIENLSLCHSRESGNPDDIDSPVKPGNDKTPSFTGRLPLLFNLSAAILLIFLLRLNSASQFNQPAFSLLRRLDYWKETLGVIRLFPFLGAGLGNLDLSQARYAHNACLQIWAEMGVLGIASFLWLIVETYSLIKRDFLSKKSISVLSTAIFAFLIHNLVDFTFFLPEVNLIWWIISGIYCSSQDPEVCEGTPPIPWTKT